MNVSIEKYLFPRSFIYTDSLERVNGKNCFAGDDKCYAL